MSDCINNGINIIYVLTQFNSQSINLHIDRTYNLVGGIGSFIEVHFFFCYRELIFCFHLNHDRLEICYVRYWQQLKHSVNREISGFRVLSML